jgi:hypothetical protein
MRRRAWRPWSGSRLPSKGSARAPRPRPPRRIGCCHPPRSRLAAGADPRPPPGCPAQGLRGMLGLVVPDDHGEERRLLLPPPRHRHPERRPSDPTLGIANLGLVGEVAGEAHGCLGHGLAPFCCLAGRSALPLEPGDGGRRGMPKGHQGQAVEPTKSAIDQGRRPWVGSGAGLVGGALAAGGRACQHRPARSLHPGRGGRTRLPPRGPLVGPSQATTATG